MKIQITGSGHDLNLTLPTKLIFSKFLIRTVLKHVEIGPISAKQENVSAKLEKLSPEMVDCLLDELHRIRKKYGSWELVEVHSADGEYVKITL